MNAKEHDQRKVVFTVMPIGKGPSDDFYKYWLQPMVKGMGLQCVRADEIPSFGSPIIETVHSHLANSAMVIADITGQNPNVLYEIGYRYAKGGPVILLAKSLRDIPSDLEGRRIVVYDVNSPRGQHKAKEAIEAGLKWMNVA